jgi:tRNA (cmo5U34)-methyltransferase
MVTEDMHKSEWQTIAHTLAYLARADKLPHRTEGEKALLDQIPQSAKRVLNLGSGDGRLLALVKLNNPAVEGVALDFSDPMLKQAQKRFANNKHVTIVKHDSSLPLPVELGRFDAVVSSLAIHPLTTPKKKTTLHRNIQLVKPYRCFLQPRTRFFSDRKPARKIFSRYRLNS